MIHIERDRAAIPESFSGKIRVKKAKELLRAFLEANAKGKSLDAAYWKRVGTYWKKAKDRLQAESFDKCAYCETSTGAAAFGDVEHFRPKAKYWWLAFCFDNYLYSCQRCNQQFKGDEFPIGAAARLAPKLPPGIPADDEELDAIAAQLAPDGSAAAFKKYVALTRAEQAGLPDPYVEDPEELFKWDPGPEALREVRIAPADGSKRAKAAFNAAEKYFGLNRPELLRLRWIEYQILDKTRTLAAPHPAAVRGEIFKVLLSDGVPFLGMKRYFVKKVWQLI